MNRFNIIAFTHSSAGLEELAKFHLEQELVCAKMEELKQRLKLSEVMYLSTCNRTEFLMVSEEESNEANIGDFLAAFNSEWDQEQIENLSLKAKSWNGINAVNHLIEVASSLDSMVLGEREIITQVKDSFNFAFKHHLCSDMIRIVVRQTVETAKKIYTHTDISKKPVSVVSLAYQNLVSKVTDLESRVIVVGAGTTNTNMVDFLQSHGFKHFTIFNRSLENAQKLANKVNAEAYTLEDLKTYSKGFDILLTCTASSEHIIHKELYHTLLAGEEGKKYVVDLSIPNDFDPSLTTEYDVDHISVEFLKGISDANLQERRKELIKVRQIIYESIEEFKEIFKMRQMEIKMRSIPQKVKEIRTTAMEEVFSKDIAALDDNSKETLEKILNYMEKKYVSVPMIMAKEFVNQKKEEE
ncbi:MAG: glutamyl-tRNA reductase [Flavobacteriales bacterium]|nr:glutamyl-tRNA reductase [Flavobacteriales bacterium]